MKSKSISIFPNLDFMKVNIEKIISFLYLACIIWIVGLFFATSITLIYKIFSGNYLFGVDSVFSVLDNVAFIYFTVPLFLIFKIIFWRKNKRNLDKKNVNQTSKNIKKISYLVVLVFILVIFVYANFSNPSLVSDYNFHSIDSLWMFIRDFVNLIIFPILLIFFAINFLTSKDIDQKNHNLLDLVLFMIFAPILVNFTKTIAFIAYDCELVIYYFIKHLIG